MNHLTRFSTLVLLKVRWEIGAAADISLVKFWEKTEAWFSRMTRIGGRPAGCKDVCNASGGCAVQVKDNLEHEIFKQKIIKLT